MRKLYARVLCCLLTAVLAVTGCSDCTTNTINPGATRTTTLVPQATQSIGAPTVHIEGIPEVSSPGNDLVSYDPEREIYFSCENVNLDIYGDTTHPIFAFYIFSKKPLDVNKIEVRLPIESPYESGVMEIPFARMTSYMAEENGLGTSDTFPRNLFKTYCGVDFAEMGELMCWLNDRRNLSDPDYTAKAERYQQMQEMYEAEFQNLQPEELPEIYKYGVSFFIPSKTRINETFHAIDIVIDGVVYHQQIGVVRLMTEMTPMDYPLGDYYGKLASGTNMMLYTDGMHAMIPYHIKLKEDAVLHRLHIVNEDVEVVTLRLKIDGKVVDWNGNEPLQVYAGETITVQVVYKSPYFEKMFHNMIVYFELDAMIDGEMQAWPAQLHHDCHHANPYLVNAIVFDGLDVSSMFRDYTYRSDSSWQYHFPELRDDE